ncbi:MAG: hypothetical protein ABR976_10125 [Terracidiphilus sp.]|jgi:hypothetical protein
MRVILGSIGMLAVMQGFGIAQSSPATQQPRPAMPEAQLVREVVYNELNDHQGHGYWRYWIERHTTKETRVEDQIETAQGPVTRLTLSNGRPISTETEQQEEARLHHLLNSREEQARHLQDYEEDEKRIGRILAFLPDAFIYQYAGEENGCIRLSFKPNPAYPAHSIEARIFHSMSGTLWVDARMKRLARLDGHVQENLDFGYGILGRLYKGGWFQLVRTQVSATDWKTERLEVHMVGRALLVKSFARETSEVRGGFVPVPAGMNLAQGMALLEQTQAQSQSEAAPRAKGLVTPTVLALRP